MVEPIARKLLVVGGTGFLGINVCRIAAQRGWNIVSLSRSGEPKSFQQDKPKWAEKVHWASGDLLDTESYKSVLSGVTDVVHSVGILLEKDYKSLARSQSLGEAVDKLPGLFLNDHGNPLDPKQENTIRLTYEMMNRDTVISVADEVAKLPSIRSFVYISASRTLPLIDPRYYTTKREAETYLFRKENFKTVALRPGLMYDNTRPILVPVVGMLKLANALTNPFKKDIASLPGGRMFTTPPLETEQVAKAVIASIEASNHGIFDVDDIEKLSHTLR